MPQMNSGVYEIVNLVNGKKYIGSSVNIKHRFRQHISRLKLKKHHAKHLQNAWNKYGFENFSFQIIEQCDISILIQREQFYLDFLNPEYNVLRKAGSSLGTKVSDEARKKISEKLKGRHAWNKGKKMNDETRKKLSEKMKGKPAWNKGKTDCFSEETKKLWSKQRKGKIPWSKGKKMNNETRKKLSESHKGIRNISSIETLKKLAKQRIGTHLSEETKKKIGEANKRIQENKKCQQSQQS